MVRTTGMMMKRKTDRTRRVLQLCLVAAVYTFIACVILIFRVWNSYPETDENDRSERVKRDSVLSVGENETNCIPRAVDNFLGNFFTLKDTQDGGVFIHILLVMYLFGALAVVCDDYFVSSLERICDDLHLQEDVAGATFMAAGSSAPELFTSIIGVFFAKSDVGTGTIVGSAVFNILVIIGLSGLLTGSTVQLSRWPVVRDTVYYLLSVLALVLVMTDNKVYWYEALTMFLMYIIYIVIMYFNRRLETKAESLLNNIGRWFLKQKLDENNEKHSLMDDTEESLRYSGDITETVLTNDPNSDNVHICDINVSDLDVESTWSIPENFFLRVFWVAMVPIKALLYVTVPDCKRAKLRKLYMVTFTMSVVWIAVFSYLMVWMVTIAGDALGIPDTVMGLTLLAAGTSVPDCISSVLVARNGYGDMAVSNSVGSNVFDILMCLGFPWLLYAIAFSEDHLEIRSSGLLYSSLTLLSTVAFLFVAFALNHWRLTKTVGVVFVLVYFIVIALSCLYELNIFGEFNPPPCPR